MPYSSLSRTLFCWATFEYRYFIGSTRRIEVMEYLYSKVVLFGIAILKMILFYAFAHPLDFFMSAFRG